MTDLTEQWKKGELPEGWYYVKDIHNEERLDRYFKETDNFEYLEDWEVVEVLAPVPSYEELDKLNNACHELEKETACLTVDIVKLKELLKDCHLAIFDYPPFDLASDKIRLMNKIDEVLK